MRPHPARDLRAATDPTPRKKESYRLFMGNTHAHCRYSGDAVQTDENSVENHFRLAKANGYDFYCVTDHSQYESYTPQAWEHIKAAADAATDASFVAIRGYEHSENNGPGAKGHQNVYNSSDYLNALAEGIDMPYFHNWLADAANAGAVVSMNHPGKEQYGGFACYNEQARPHIRLIELINGTDDYHESFLAALAKGWKVSPVAGCDNHATKPIAAWQPRTGVAAKKLTRESLLEAMAAGRTYATYDKNLRLLYYVNNHVMGSEIRTSADELTFEIEASDPGYVRCVGPHRAHRNRRRRQPRRRFGNVLRTPGRLESAGAPRAEILLSESLHRFIGRADGLRRARLDEINR